MPRALRWRRRAHGPVGQLPRRPSRRPLAGYTSGIYSSLPADEVPIGATWRCIERTPGAMVYKSPQWRPWSSTAASFCPLLEPAIVCPRPSSLQECGLRRPRSAAQGFSAQDPPAKNHPPPSAPRLAQLGPRARGMDPADAWWPWTSVLALPSQHCRRPLPTCLLPTSLLPRRCCNARWLRPPAGAHTAAQAKRNRTGAAAARGGARLYQVGPGATGGRAPEAVGDWSWAVRCAIAPTGQHR